MNNDKKKDPWPYDEGREAYEQGISRNGEIPFYDNYEDECLWVDGWDDAKREDKADAV